MPMLKYRTLSGKYSGFRHFFFGWYFIAHAFAMRKQSSNIIVWFRSYLAGKFFRDPSISRMLRLSALHFSITVSSSSFSATLWPYV
ncbi:hypothetical protein, partial [Candidatus Symbiopectobacterium sp.]|uniref:hypothetical protein n=1 Tax=Candidatus Symbiopectobacterium sp. TaxID=2816440 RepID=UPI0025B7C386